MNRIRLVTFDVTGCLLRLRRPVGETYAKVAAGHGLNLQPSQRDQLTAAFKESYVDLDTRFPCFGANHGVSEKDWWRQLVLHSFRKVGVLGQSQRLDRIFNDLYQRFATPDEWAVDDNVPFILPELWRRGVKLGLITNFDNRIYELMNWTGISGWLHFVVNSRNIGSAKPNPAIFEAAAKEATKFLDSDVKSMRETWLHVGSDWNYDVYGAKKAGIAWAARYSCVANDKSRRPDELASLEGVAEFKSLRDINQVVFPREVHVSNRNGKTTVFISLSKKILIV